MRTIRIFHPEILQINSLVKLHSNAANHVARVLRLTPNDIIHLFNGTGGEYVASLQQVERQTVIVKVTDYVAHEVESPLSIHLGQVISRGDKMDFTIQKAVELGVSDITPLFSERCGVKLDKERLAKKVEHWQGVIISACEQSGRNRLPKLHEPQMLEPWLNQQQGLRFILAPGADQSLKEMQVETVQQATLLIGPEGGLSDTEIRRAKEQDFTELKLGPRILRTETAGLVAITLLQSYWGDLT